MIKKNDELNRILLYSAAILLYPAAFLIVAFLIWWEAWIIFSYWKFLPLPPVTMLQVFSGMMIWTVTTYKYKKWESKEDATKAFRGRIFTFLIVTIVYYII